MKTFDIPTEINSRHELFTTLGLDISKPNSKNIIDKFKFETPCRINNAVFKGDSYIGAFSYCSDGLINYTHIGRYCSIARSVNIGQFDHPTDWLSTNPFQYQRTFKIATGSEYKFKLDYDNDTPKPRLQSLANKSVTKITTIGNDVWIGHGAIIISGITIGNGAIIAAGAVVTKDVAPYSIVGGVPAKHIKYRFSQSIVAALQKIQWWNYAPWQLREIDFENIEAAISQIEKIQEPPHIPHKYEITKNIITEQSASII